MGIRAAAVMLIGKVPKSTGSGDSVTRRCVTHRQTVASAPRSAQVGPHGEKGRWKCVGTSRAHREADTLAFSLVGLLGWSTH